MSYEEAREVVLSMQNVPMEPPPRKMDDILAVLEKRRGSESAYIEALVHRADMAPPKLQDPRNLYQFYKSRANARYELSRFNECRGDIRTAIAYDKQANIGDGALRQRLAELEMLAGRYESALELSRAAINVYKVSSWRANFCQAFQSRIHHRMGNFFRADTAIRKAKAAFHKIPPAARIGIIIDGGIMDFGNESDFLAAEAEILEAKGRYDNAHELRARVFNYHFSKRKLKPVGSVHAQMALADNLMGQRRLILAEKRLCAVTLPDIINI